MSHLILLHFLFLFFSFSLYQNAFSISCIIQCLYLELWLKMFVFKVKIKMYLVCWIGANKSQEKIKHTAKKSVSEKSKCGDWMERNNCVGHGMEQLSATYSVGLTLLKLQTLQSCIVWWQVAVVAEWNIAWVLCSEMNEPLLLCGASRLLKWNEW